LLWANAKWRGPRIHGLRGLAKLIGNAETTKLLNALDRACYAADPWDGTALANALPDLPLPKPTDTVNTRELAPLYH